MASTGEISGIIIGVIVVIIVCCLCVALCAAAAVNWDRISARLRYAVGATPDPTGQEEEGEFETLPVAKGSIDFATVLPSVDDDEYELRRIIISDDDACIVCTDQRKVVTFMPCGHLACCQRCTVGIQESSGKCPMCRDDIRGSRIDYAAVERDRIVLEHHRERKKKAQLKEEEEERKKLKAMGISPPESPSSFSPIGDQLGSSAKFKPVNVV